MTLVFCRENQDLEKTPMRGQQWTRCVLPKEHLSARLFIGATRCTTCVIGKALHATAAGWSICECIFRAWLGGNIHLIFFFVACRSLSGAGIIARLPESFVDGTFSKLQSLWVARRNSVVNSNLIDFRFGLHQKRFQNCTTDTKLLKGIPIVREMLSEIVYPRNIITH